MPEVSPGSTKWLERGPGPRQQTRRSTRPLALAGWVAGLVPAMIAGGCTNAPSHGPVAGADGTYVVADAEQVTLRDARGTVRSRSGGSGFVIDGNQIAVYGRDALALVAPGRWSRLNRPVYSAGFSPDGSAIAYVRAADQGVDVFVVTLADRKSRRSPIAPTATRSSSRETARPWCATARTKPPGRHRGHPVRLSHEDEDPAPRRGLRVGSHRVRSPRNGAS